MASYPQPSGAPPIRPPLVGSADLPQNFGPPMPVQFRPVDLTQQSHQFIPLPSQHFQPTYGMPSSIAGMPAPQFIPSVQQIIPRPSYPGQSIVSSQPIPAPYIQPSAPFPSGLMQSQQNSQFQINHMLAQGGGGMPPSSSYMFSTSYDQQVSTVNAPSHYQPISQIRASVPVTMPLHDDHKSTGLPVTNSLQAPLVSTTNIQPTPAQQPSDWQEHTSSDGKRYYYNKKTKQSSWEKPVELMTAVERADASTAWKEYTSPDGRKYYYNKLTKQSKWTIPDELKMAREQAGKTGIHVAQSEAGVAPLAIVSVTPLVQNSSSTATGKLTSSPSVSVVANSVNPMSTLPSGSPSITAVPSAGGPSNSLIRTTNATNIMLNVPVPATPLPALSSATSAIVEDTTNNTELSVTVAAATKISNENSSFSSAGNLSGEKSSQELEDAKRCVSLAENINAIPQEEKPIVEEPMTYANKQEAKAAFKALLESTSIECDSTWEQAMRVIINDKRYGALKTLGERKQVFNEFLSDRKKQESEERRVKQKKTREDFIKMLEESKELTSSTRWRKAEAMFEGDDRFNAIERAKDREDIFETYIGELRKKEKAKAAEEHKRNIMEYRAFLESCDFIKASSQWRKVQDRLESDERCARLDKFDRLKVFQDYVNDLEKEEEEQQKIQKEQLRKAERKNRDDFRKLMEQHVATGILTAKTHWRDYYMEVKDLPSYLAVSSNTSGATPKDLFEDVTEELEKQYREDKTRIKDAVKIGKITLTPSSTFESFKADASEKANLQTISETNLKLIFKELLEKLWDKEEKEAKRRQRLADNFSNLLHSAKEISAASTWEECKLLLADSQHHSSPSEESLMREIFEKYVEHLQEKAKEERKRNEEKAKKGKGREDRERRKERKEKERDREKEKGKRRSRKDDMESENLDIVDTSSLDEKTRGKDKERKHRKHYRGTTDEKDGKEKSKKSRRHSSDRRKSRKHSSGSDSENKFRKRKRDRDGSHRNSSYEDLEDGELGDYGEVC